MARMLDFLDLHDLHRLQYFDHRDEGRCVGWRALHITDAIIPTWTMVGAGLQMVTTHVRAPGS